MPPPLDFLTFRDLPAGRLWILGGLAIMLVAADSTPAAAFGNPDRTQFALCLAVSATAITMTLVDRLTRTQWIALAARLVLVAVTVVIAAIGAEYIARWAFRDVTTSADNASFFTRRWLRTRPLQINAAGFRGPAFAQAKPAGVYRVAVVGDSFTFGNGLRQQDRYTEMMQARLPAHIEILNFGEPGANTPEHALRVRTLLDTITPDFILLQWYVNDMEDDDVTGRPAFRPLFPGGLHNRFDSRSALYSVANMKWGELQVRRGQTRSYVDYINDRLLNPHSPYSQEDSKFLHEIFDRSRNAGVPIGMVLFPDTAAPITDRYPFAYLHDRVLATCEEYKMTCVDLRQDFAQVRDHRQLWASRFDHHPSARANEIAAERILATFAAKWLK